jgi:hypothetical protein
MHYDRIWRIAKGKPCIVQTQNATMAIQIIWLAVDLANC